MKVRIFKIVEGEKARERRNKLKEGKYESFTVGWKRLKKKMTEEVLKCQQMIEGEWRRRKRNKWNYLKERRKYKRIKRSKELNIKKGRKNELIEKY